MKTLKVANGDFVLDSSGVFEEIEGTAKGAQDVAETLLTDFDSTFQDGSELKSVAVGTIGTFGESLISQIITEAINRLILKQQSQDFDSRIIGIQQLRVKVVGTSVAFLVTVLFGGGAEVSIVKSVDLKPVEMNHLFINTDNPFNNI